MCNELTKQDKIQEQIQVSAEQKLRVMNDQYVIHKMDETQYNAMASKISINAEDNIVRKNVRNAIIQNLGRARYSAIDNLKIKKPGGAEKENIVLHHAVGSKLTMDGEDVIEFNMAGSGYMNYTLMHKGVRGVGSKGDAKDEKKSTGTIRTNS